MFVYECQKITENWHARLMSVEEKCREEEEEEKKSSKE